jgi:hypothetical protein
LFFPEFFQLEPSTLENPRYTKNKRNAWTSSTQTLIVLAGFVFSFFGFLEGCSIRTLNPRKPLRKPKTQKTKRFLNLLSSDPHSSGRLCFFGFLDFFASRTRNPRKTLREPKTKNMFGHTPLRPHKSGGFVCCVFVFLDVFPR